MKKEDRLYMRASPEWLAQIDDWCQRQPGPDKPKRAQAIRQLVELGLAADAAGFVPPKTKRGDAPT